VLVGGAGDDHLIGGAGDDLLVGQSGDDDYDGGSGKNKQLETMASVPDYVVRTIIATTGDGPVKFTLDSSSECAKQIADPPNLNTSSPSELFAVQAEPWCIWGTSVRYRLFQQVGNRVWRGTMSVQVRLNPDYTLLTLNAACGDGFKCGLYGADQYVPKITLAHSRP